MPSQRYNPSYIPQDAPRGLLNAAIASPLDDAISVVERLGQRAGINAAAADAERAVMSGQNPAMLPGLTPIGQAFNESALGAYEARTSMDLRAKANELSTRFTGNNPTDPAAFAEIFDAHVREVVGSVPESIRPKIAFEANVRRSEAVSEITGRAIANQRRLQISEMEAGFKAAVIDADDRARQGKHDLAATALLQSFDRVDTMVRAGAISEGEAELLKTKAKGQMAAGTLYEGFASGRVSAEAIISGEAGGNLPGDIRERLIRDVESEQAHRRVMANEAITIRNSKITANGRVLDGINKKVELGVPLSDAEKATRDAILGAPDLVDPTKHAEATALRATENVAREVASYSREKVEALRASFNAAPPADVAEALRRKRLVEAFDKRESAIRQDAAEYVQSVAPDLYPPVILPDDPAAPEFDAALATAAQNLGRMREHIGGNPNPLTAAQQKQLADRLAIAPPAEAAEIMAKIERAFGPDASVIQSGLRKKGALPFARAGAMANAGRPDIARDIIDGNALLKSKAVVFKPDDARVSAMKSDLLVAVGGNARAEQELREAAMALAAKRRPDNPLEAFDDALKEVGGVVGYYNGGPVLLPVGVSETQFLDRLAGLEPADVAAMSGVEAGAAEVAAQVAAGRATLESRGDGRYRVRIGNSYFPHIIDFAKIPARPMVRQRFAIPVEDQIGGADPSGR